MRIFTADNETVLTFAGTLFTIDTGRAFVSHPPFSLASPAIPRLAAAPGQEPRSPIPDRPHRLPAPSTTPLAPSPRHHSTILFHSRALIARIALESHRARVPFRRFVPVPRERRADRLGRHRRPETSLAHRGSHRDARASTHRVRRHFFSILSRARTADGRLREGRGVRTSRAAIAGRKRSARSVVVDPLAVDRDRPILDGSRLENASHRPSSASRARARRLARARRRRVGSSTAIDRASAFVRSFVRSFVRARWWSRVDRSSRSSRAGAREDGRAGRRVREREREGSTRGAEDGDGSTERCRW